MENILKIGRLFYGFGIVCLGIQQFMYADFRPVFLPPWPSWAHASPVWAYISCVILVVTGVFLLWGNRIASLVLAGFFFFLFLAAHVPYLLLIGPNSPRHLGLWTNPLKVLALSGGALVMAASDPLWDRPIWMRIGIGFFSLTLLSFGIDHFYYSDFVAMLVPAWTGGAFFWTYFAGIALIGAGVGMIGGMAIGGVRGVRSAAWMRVIALLTAIMLFCWVLMLHIPRALAAPISDQGNEVTSVWEALAFTGIALVIGWRFSSKFG